MGRVVSETTPRHRGRAAKLLNHRRRALRPELTITGLVRLHGQPDYAVRVVAGQPGANQVSATSSATSYVKAKRTSSVNCPNGTAGRPFAQRSRRELGIVICLTQSSCVGNRVCVHRT